MYLALGIQEAGVTSKTHMKSEYRINFLGNLQLSCVTSPPSLTGIWNSSANFKPSAVSCTLMKVLRYAGGTLSSTELSMQVLHTKTISEPSK